MDAFEKEILDAPWGMLSRAHVDYLVFRLLVQSGRFDLSGSDFTLANELRTSVTRIRALRYRFEQDEARASDAGFAALLTEANFAFESAGDGKIRVSIRSRYLREFFASELARRGSIALTEMTPSTLLVSMDDFVLVVVEVGANGEWLETAEGQAAHNQLIEKLMRLKDVTQVQSIVALWAEQVKGAVSVASGMVTVLKAAMSAGLPNA